jgi:hypothetical protein
LNERPEHERFASEAEESEVHDTEQPDADGEISVTIAVDVAWCDECGAYAEMGAENCPGCSAVVDVDWEQRAHLYRARREVFGDLAEVLKAPSDYTTVVPVTEQQYLRFINGSHVLSAGPVSRMTRTINSLDFSEPSTIRGARTREAATVLYQDALKLRRLIATLKSMKPYGAFAQPHEHLIGAFEAYREHFRELAGALLARGPSEVEAHYGNTDATHTESPNFAEGAKYEVRSLSSRTFRLPPSVSQAGNRDLGDREYWDSRIEQGTGQDEHDQVRYRRA